MPAVVPTASELAPSANASYSLGAERMVKPPPERCSVRGAVLPVQDQALLARVHTQVEAQAQTQTLVLVLVQAALQRVRGEEQRSVKQQAQRPPRRPPQLHLLPTTEG